MTTFTSIVETTHFYDRVEEHLDAEFFPELAEVGFTELAELLLTATEEVTLRSGDTYREVFLNGVEFGIGFSVRNGELAATTLISPADVALNRRTFFASSFKTVTPFAG